mgnify:FL=1
MRLLLAFFLALPLFAQPGRGTILGTVAPNVIVVNVPVWQHWVNTFADLSPSVRPATWQGSLGGISVNGQREKATIFNFDGTSAQSPHSNVETIAPSIDAVAEFKITTEIPSAKFAHAAGGPIYGKNRPFFFASFQGTRHPYANPQVLLLPDPRWIGGDFSGYRQIYDPQSSTYDAATNRWSRVPFVGNQIPASRQDPVARKIAPYFPAPNRPPTMNPWGPASNFLRCSSSG